MILLLLFILISLNLFYSCDIISTNSTFLNYQFSSFISNTYCITLSSSLNTGYWVLNITSLYIDNSQSNSMVIYDGSNTQSVILFNGINTFSNYIEVPSVNSQYITLIFQRTNSMLSSSTTIYANHVSNGVGLYVNSTGIIDMQGSIDHIYLLATNNNMGWEIRFLDFYLQSGYLSVVYWDNYFTSIVSPTVTKPSSVVATNSNGILIRIINSSTPNYISMDISYTPTTCNSVGGTQAISYYFTAQSNSNCWINPKVFGFSYSISTSNYTALPNGDSFSINNTLLLNSYYNPINFLQYCDPSTQLCNLHTFTSFQLNYVLGYNQTLSSNINSVTFQVTNYNCPTATISGKYYIDNLSNCLVFNSLQYDFVWLVRLITVSYSNIGDSILACDVSNQCVNNFPFYDLNDQFSTNAYEIVYFHNSMPSVDHIVELDVAIVHSACLQVNTNTNFSITVRPYGHTCWEFSLYPYIPIF